MVPKGKTPFSEEFIITKYLTLGPFVLPTDGAFETEYLYERHKILDCDYLLPSGGEKNIVPFEGQKVINNYYGNDYLYWTKNEFERGSLKFNVEGTDSGKAIFVTEQRNCVCYAAFYVECAKESNAVICYENSGSYLFLNGELIDKKPYGRVKGLSTTGNQAAVTFKKGLNLIMFKIRPGYIADGLDFCMTNCIILPIMLMSGSTGITYPVSANAYFGTKDEPRQIFPAFTGCFGKPEESEFSYSAKGWKETIQIQKQNTGKCGLIRISVPSDIEPKTVEVKSILKEKGKTAVNALFYVPTVPFGGYDGTEYLNSDFHFDTTYHQEQRTYAMGAIHITKCMLEELERNPEFKATLSEIDYLHPYYAIYPEHRATMKKMFTEGRAESDCFYNQPNDLTSSGEGFVRNLIYGQLYHDKVLGRKCYVYSPGDVFGHFSQMSQVCKKGEVIALRWGKTIWGLDSIMHHMSPDGTELIHEKNVGVDTAKRLGLKHSGAAGRFSSFMHTYPQEGDTSWQGETINKARNSVFSDRSLGIIEDDKRITQERGISTIEYTSRDITQHHSGVLLTRTDFKQANRLAENLLITAEKFASVAALYGAEYPEKALDKAWRQLLCAQHHDSVTGTNNEISFVDLMIEYRESVQLAADIVNSAIAFIASGVEIEKNSIPYFIFNPHPWKREEKCEITLPLSCEKGSYALFDSGGKEYSLTVTGRTNKGIKAVFIPSVPALGYESYSLKKSAKKADVIAVSGESSIQNKYFKLTVDANQGGGIVSIYDRINRREVLDTKTDGPANRIVVLKEVPDRCETQHEFYTTGHKLFSSDYKAVVVSEKCDTFEKLSITVRLDIVAKIKQEITLYKNSDKIDMKTTVEDYQGRDDLFTLTFPVQVNGGKVVYDDRYAPHIAGTSKNKLTFQTHQYFVYSHARIVPANQWLDFGPSLTLNLMNGNKYSGSFNIGMTAIIRCENTPIMQSSVNLMTALTKKFVPVTLFSDGKQFGGTRVTHYNEDLYNTDTRFVLSLNSDKNEYAKKLLKELPKAKREAFEARMKKQGAAVLYVKDSDNEFKKPIDVILIQAKNIKLLDEIIEDIGENLKYLSSFDLSAIIASEAGNCDDYGVALLNNGTISCSVEGENLMNMMLFHTAEFYGNQGKVTGADEMIPEQKTHVFTYAMYPHKGSFKDADVYKKGLEFNDPLLVTTDALKENKKVLPKSKSFFSCDKNFVLTTLKAGGYPIAEMKGTKQDIEERGLTIRGFEPNGIDTSVKFNLPFTIKEIYNVNLLDNERAEIKGGKNSFKSDVGSGAIETFAVYVEKPEEKIGEAVIGAEKEIVEPTYVRSWEHDLGTMPMGYLAAAGVINRKCEKIDDTTYQFNVSMSNSRTDINAKGTMKLTMSKGFKASKTSFKYDVEPGGCAVFPVTITKPSADANGQLRLQYEDDGQLFEDIFEFGYFNPELRLRIENDKIIASVMNLTGEELSGEIAVATPFETWDCAGHNTCSIGDISPMTQKVTIKNGETKDFIFDANIKEGDILNSYWAAVKLMVNGRIHFGYATKLGPRHNMWTHEFTNSIHANNDSLERLLKMN